MKANQRSRLFSLSTLLTVRLMMVLVIYLVVLMVGECASYSWLGGDERSRRYIFNHNAFSHSFESSEIPKVNRVKSRGLKKKIVKTRYLSQP